MYLQCNKVYHKEMAVLQQGAVWWFPQGFKEQITVHKSGVCASHYKKYFSCFDSANQVIISFWKQNLVH